VMDGDALVCIVDIVCMTFMVVAIHWINR
jgi:hypothetical protein